MIRAGVDVGGTFTDVVVIDEATGTIDQRKVPSDPSQLEVGIVDGLSRTLGSAERVEQLSFIGHGTTVATNVTLERTGPRVALLCTRGFRDVLEIARLAKPGSKLYTHKSVMPEPVVSRRDSFEITERVDAGGRITAELDEQDVRDAMRTIVARGIKAVAVCLLFSFRNPTNERRVREIIAEVAPEVEVSLSSEVWPEFREYERASTTSLNCYLRPAAWTYLDRLRTAIADTFPASTLWVMQSNGGLTSPEAAADLPVRLVMSGPAGGVIGAKYIAEQTGLPNLINVDMGGTSFDVSLILNGAPSLVDQQSVMGLPVKGRALDILTIGSGGGSIAWVDGAGAFRVGPRSAGAFPGPACYGRGGLEPTVTDANLVLGYFDPGLPIAGGDLQLDYDAAYQACARLGKELDMTATEIAWGIRSIVNAAMANAVRAASVRRGHDPRNFALLGFGGAGPLHSVDIAAEMGMKEVVIPDVAGCFSALGIAITDAVHDLVQTETAVVVADSVKRVADGFANLVAEGRAELDGSGIAADQQQFAYSLDLRYKGQNAPLNIGLGSAAELHSAVAEFHQEHHRQFGYNAPEEPVEVVNLRVRAVGTIGRTHIHDGRAVERHEVAPTHTRRVHVGATDTAMAGIFDRTQLAPGASFQGPAVVTSDDTTVVVPPSARGHIDRSGHLRIDLETR
ncbi:MAG: hydantoinase/oxoprolinase family protein [Mycobacterium sp.]